MAAASSSAATSSSRVAGTACAEGATSTALSSTTAASVSARLAFEMAAVRPADVDVAQLYDSFSIVPVMTLED